MSSINRVIIMGNITRDPELQTVSSGAQVCELGIAMDRTWTDNDGNKQEETTFVDVTLWGRNAENAARFLAKGRSVFVEGRLQLSSWKDAQTGQDRSKLRVVGERIQFLGGPSEEGGSSANSQRMSQGRSSRRQPAAA